MWANGLLPLTQRPGDPAKDPVAVARGRAAGARRKERKFQPVANPWDLSPAEYAVMAAMVESGDSWSEIAEQLHMGHKTAATHSWRARDKMGAKNTIHAVLMLDRWLRAEKVDLELVVRFLGGRPSIEMRTAGAIERPPEPVEHQPV